MSFIQLNYFRYAFGLPCDQNEAHRAGDDTKVCWELLRYICNYILDNVIDINDISEDFDLGEFLYEYSKSTIEMDTMPFGKHKAQKFCDIPISYFNWLLRNSYSINEDHDDYDPDLALAVEKELNRRLDLESK